MQNTNQQQQLMDYEFSKRDARKIKKKPLFTGIVLIILALVGVLAIVSSAAGRIIGASKQKKLKEINEYNSFLIPVAAVDPLPFDDVTTATAAEMIEISIWSIIGSDLDPEDYDYSSGDLTLPAAQVESAFVKYFGNTVQIEHQSVEGYGYRFEYSEADLAYHIPLTGISPVYAPNVQSTEEKNGVITVICGLVSSGAWQQNHQTGQFTEPEPDKYITVTLREQSGMTYISAIGTTGGN